MTEDEIAKIHTDAYNWEQERIRKEALLQLFKKEGVDYDLMDFRLLRRCFLWIKTAICLVLKRTSASYLDKNSFCVLSFNERYDMSGSGWDAVWVSSDYFSGWNVCIGSDGT